MRDNSTERGGDGGTPSEHWRISRRLFVAGGGATAATLMIDARGVVLAAPRDVPILRRAKERGGTVVQWVRRREDGLLLRFEFLNMKRDKSAPQVTRKQTQDPSYVVVVFPPQHVYEEAFFETEEVNLEPSEGEPSQPDPAGGDETPTPRPVGARLSGESRLVFELPDDTDSIDLGAGSLLDWVHWRMSVVPSAQTPPPNARQLPYLTAPDAHHTAIELPWWLILSPHRDSVWAHSHGPVEHDSRTELWHTRLASRGPVRQDQPLPDAVNEYWDADRTVRAVWALDDGMDLTALIRQYPTPVPNPPELPDGTSFPQDGSPFRSSLTPRDRVDIVLSSADHIGHSGGSNYTPPPVDVERLMLTSMGAWIDSQGQWDPFSTGRSLEDWTQHGTHGRDNYVRIIRAGNFACFGHRCSLIKITERKFDEAPDSPVGTAYLRQRLYIVRRQRLVRYGAVGPYPHQGREFPFVSAELVTAVTPNLDIPEPFSQRFPEGTETRLFVPMVNGEPFEFHVRLTDKDGRIHDIATPLVFVDFDLSSQASEMTKLIDDFDDGAVNAGMEGVLSHDFNEKIAVVPPIEPGGDDTTLDVTTMRWGLQLPTVNLPPGQLYAPYFVPTMTHVDVRFTAAEVASGGAVDTTRLVLDEAYVQNEWAGNAGDVFVQLLDANNPTMLGYGSQGNGDRVGGSIEPALGITGVSRRNGVVSGDIVKVRSDVFDPSEFFNLASAKLLGGITLADVISFVTNDLDAAPKLQQREIKDAGGEPIGSEVRLDWETLLKPFSAGPADNIFLPLDYVEPVAPRAPDLLLHSETFEDYVDPTKSRSKFMGELRRFQVNLFGDGPPAGFIAVDFDYVRFTSLNGAKPTVDVGLNKVTFRDPLDFVQKLDPYLKSAGLGGLFIDLQPTGVTAGYSIGLPSIEIGAFSLQNIAIAAGVTIPFTGQPVRVRFGFCTRDNPFILTIMCFGGGGFLGLGIGADGVEVVEAALEARAQIGLNIAVASGSVSAALGLYFKYELLADNSERVELTGYLRLQGKVRVMGIVSVSVEFYLSFTYESTTKKVTGQATLTIEIDVLLFSGSVSMTVERRFGGSGDPTFGEMYAPDDWNDYVAAFAA